MLSNVKKFNKTMNDLRTREIMKKFYSFLAISILFVSGVFAQIANLVVEAQGDPYTSGVYEHKGTYNQKHYWVGPKGNNRYVISFSKNYKRWDLDEWYGDTSQIYGMYRDYTSSTDEYPTIGWNFIKVTKEGPAIKFSQTKVTESSSDDGRINDIISITHNKLKGQGFAGTAGTDLIASNAITVERVPAGLTAKAFFTNDSMIDLVFDGASNDHTIDTNILVKFTDAAFTNGGKADSTQNSTTTISINFIKKITVAKSGGDYVTVQEGLTKAEDGDVVYIKEGVYTEEKMTLPQVAQNITILGDGPDKTILQADTTPFTAKSRVLDIGSTLTARIDGITFQNGNDQRAGGINGGQMLDINNCRIINNRAYQTPASQTVSGGIFCAHIIMTNCEVVGNICDNGGKNGQVYGGGIAMQTYNKTHRIENSTFAKNYSRIGGAAIGNFMGNLEIINCTITDNEVTGNFDNAQYPNEGIGGGIWSQDSVWMYNSICWNNKGTLGADIYTTNGVFFPVNSIVGRYSNYFKDSTKLIVGTYKNINPKLDTLAFNCSPTRTFALLEGSPAIDSANENLIRSVLDQRGFAIVNGRDIGAHESNNLIALTIDADTACLDGGELVYMSAYPNKGTFEGEGVTGNQFDPTKITKEGWVVISYKFSAPGCGNYSTSDSIYVKVCTPNNVKDINALPVSIFPNPTQNELNIHATSNSTMNVMIADISGKTIMNVSELAPRSNINVESLPNGLYFITVQSNGKTAHMKFVKN